MENLSGEHFVRPGSAADRGISARSIERLYAEYRHTLLRFFNANMRNSADSEDLLQEVFVRISRMNDFALIDDFDRYMFRIATNLVRDRYRRTVAQRAIADAPVDQIAPSATFTPERIMLDKELMHRLLTTLEELPEPTRRTFSLYHFDSVPQIEIARRSSTSISTVEKRMAKANAFLLSRCRQWDSVINR